MEELEVWGEPQAPISTKTTMELRELHVAQSLGLQTIKNQVSVGQ